MSRLLIVLFCCLVGVQSKCLRAPVGRLPDGCKVRNLTVTVAAYPSYQIINQTLCNATTNEGAFNYPPQNVRFQYIMGSYTPGMQYMLTVVDVTSRSLIWMVSNLTMSSDYTIYPTSNGRYSRELMSWKKPYLRQYSRSHVIEYLVFEEHRNAPWRTYIENNGIYASPFNLSVWIDSQQSSGITLCGPVGGGSAVAFQPPPAPAPGPSPYHTSSPTPPNSNHHKGKGKSNSNRNLFNGLLLAGLVLVLGVFGF